MYMYFVYQICYYVDVRLQKYPGTGPVRVLGGWVPPDPPLKHKERACTRLHQIVIQGIQACTAVQNSSLIAQYICPFVIKNDLGRADPEPYVIMQYALDRLVTQPR